MSGPASSPGAEIPAVAILLSLVMRDRGPRGYTERRVTNRDPRTGDQYDEVHVDRDR